MTNFDQTIETDESSSLFSHADLQRHAKKAGDTAYDLLDAKGFADAFDFVESGFSEVSGMGGEQNVVEYREGVAHSPEWTDHNDSDPGARSVSSDPEWRYLPVRRTQAEDDGDAPMLWDDGLF